MEQKVFEYAVCVKTWAMAEKALSGMTTCQVNNLRYAKPMKVPNHRYIVEYCLYRAAQEICLGEHNADFGTNVVIIDYPT